MQRKLWVKTFIILALIGWSFYALWPSYRLHCLSEVQKAELAAKGKLIPLIEKSIRLGLDLQGGMYLTLEVDLPTLIEQIAKVKDETLSRITQECREEMNVTAENFLDILVRHFVKEHIPLHRYWGEYGDSDAKVLNYLNKEAREAMNRSLEILRNRVDQFGVSEPSIQHVGATRILIELPGISDPDQAKTLIGKTALLEFALLKDPNEYTQTMERIDKALAAEKRGKASTELASKPDTSKTQKEAQQSRDQVISVEELFGSGKTVSVDTAQKDSALLVDEQIFNEHPFLALLRSTQGYQGREVSVPVENVKAVEAILDRPDIQKLMPSGSQFLWSSETFHIGDKAYRELFLVKKDPELTGKYLTNAQVAIGEDVQSAGKPVVHFELNRQGARIFSQVTGANVGKRLAIILDKRVYSAPVIQEKIPGGQGRITGIGDMEEAKMLAIVLRAGALPAPVSIIEERIVGPSLGLDSISKGTKSALIASLVVAIFMFLYYRAAGLIANFALVLNIFLLFAALAQFRFTLTMPGIAGVVLTIGMAVDANVLIFERIREELRTGKTVRASIEAGYTKAFSAIFDSNITTLFTAIILYLFGTGPVKGFAVTLMIGLIVNLFTAVVVTRTIYDQILARKTLTKLSI